MTSAARLASKAGCFTAASAATALDNHTAVNATSDYSVAAAAVVGGLVSIIIVFTVVSNALVLYVFLSERTLRRQRANWFLVSLALADFLVGLAICPLTLTYELLGYWPFGPVLCELWLAADVLICSASILNICMIGLDRYWTLTDPTGYAYHKSLRSVVLMLSLPWLLSLLIAFPPLVGWRPQQANQQCMVSNDIGYVIYSSLGSFYAPVGVMALAYARIYRITQQRSMQIREKITKTQRMYKAQTGRDITSTDDSSKLRASKRMKSTETLAHCVDDMLTLSLLITERYQAGPQWQDSDELSERTPSPVQPSSPSLGYHAIHHILKTRRVSELAGPNSSSSLRVVSPLLRSIVHESQRRKLTSISVPSNGMAVAGLPTIRFTSAFDLNSNGQAERRDSLLRSCEALGNHITRRLRTVRRRERQSALLLGFVLAAFVCCWGPFFVIYVYNALAATDLPELVFDIFFFLGYCNSALNPAVYGVFNPEFRKALLKTLRLRRTRQWLQKQTSV